MERAQRILKKFSKILKEQGAGPLFTTFKGYVTYALYDRWKVRRLRKFPPRMVKNRILFETNDDLQTIAGLFLIIWLQMDIIKNMSLSGWFMSRRSIRNTRRRM